jgi:hypothetical protein
MVDTLNDGHDDNDNDYRNSSTNNETHLKEGCW